MPITSLLGDALERAGTDLDEFDDLRRFELAVLHPVRTLLEKLALVHMLALGLAESEKRLDGRTGRHFYDVFQLLGDDRVREMLKDRGTVEQVLTEVQEISRSHFGGGEEIRPADGFASSPAFDPGSGVGAQLRDAYETTMPELFFGAEAIPTWDAICARVADRGSLL